MNQATPLYEISNFHYTYSVENKGQSSLEAYELVLDELAIQRGRLTAILGPGGCGKIYAAEPLFSPGRLRNYRTPGVYKSWGSSSLNFHR